MSRGAPRGRGRGRGGGGSSAARDQFNAAFAGMNKEDARNVFESFSKPLKGSGMLYPPLEKLSELPGPAPLEERIISHAVGLTRDLTDGPVGADGQRMGAPWRLASERKVVGIEIESYSDRFRPTTNPEAQGAREAGATSLNLAALLLQQETFPPALWTEYFDSGGPGGGADSARARARASNRAKKRRRLLDGDDADPAAANDEESEASADEDEDFDFEDEDEDDHQDYDHNYFDNGEGDDDDSGGEGGEDEGGRYDD